MKEGRSWWRIGRSEKEALFDNLSLYLSWGGKSESGGVQIR